MPTSTTPPRSPLDEARAAFDPLSTPDKTAFVVQATFETVGQALADTGRAVADALNKLDLDALFRPAAAPPAAPPPPPSAPPPVPPRPPVA